MEWYHLLIIDGHSKEEEQFLFNYFEAANITPDDANNKALSYKYLAVLNFKKNCVKNVEWRKFDSFQNAMQLISDCCEDLDSNAVYNSSLAADCINNLADNLPLPGSFSFDVIIGHNIFETFNVSENAEFALSLHRLSEWHSARFLLLTHETSSLSDEWLDITKAEIIKSANDFSFPFWRGPIELKSHLKPSQLYKGFEIGMVSKNKEVCHYLKLLFNISESSEHLVLYPILQVIDMCSFSSIPYHLIVPDALKLCISPNRFYSDSSKLFANIRGITGAALIVRMRYSVLAEKSKPSKVLCTNKWLRVVSSGNVKYPESCLPNCDKYLTLAIIPSKSCDQIRAFIIQNPSSLKAEFYFGAVNFWNKQSLYSFVSKTKNDEESEFSVPLVSATSFQSLLFKAIGSHKKDAESACHNAPTSPNRDDLLSSFIHSVNSSELLKLHSSHTVNTSEEEVDPSDWSERIHLLQRQIQLAEETENKRNVFMTFSPQRSLYSVSFSGDDIKKYFEPSGEARDTGMKEPMHSELNYRISRSKISLDEVIKTQWPAILDCSFDDIYYNVSKQSEEIESVGNEMVKCYVQHETASTCNNHQNQPDAPITIHANFMTPRKRPTSKSKADTSFRHDIMKPSAKVNETFFKTAEGQCNPVISTIMKTLGVSESSKNLTNSGEAARRIPRKNTIPVRCSPRKKPAVNYFSSFRDHKSKSTSQKDEKNSKELPELLKKKLRVAVATALETNNVKMNDVLFKPCFKKLFNVCLTFVKDIPQKGSTSQHMQKIADDYVKKVIEFEKQKTT